MTSNTGFRLVPKSVTSNDLERRSDSRCALSLRSLSLLSVLQVYWGHISIVYAEMNCMLDLLRYKWKYFINLSGFMFPAHSNRELVEILRLYDGANDIEGSFARSVLHFIPDSAYSMNVMTCTSDHRLRIQYLDV